MNAPAAAEARHLMRRARSAALATSQARGGRAYVSLVTVAWDLDASPILLLSELAQHTRNLKADRRASLLVEAASALANPQTGPRLTLMGRLRRSPVKRRARRFLARHPSARAYAGFADFHVYAMRVERAHFVGGFGRAAWLEGTDVVLGRAEWRALAASADDIVAHVNRDHQGTVSLCARVLLGRRGTAWKLAAVDPEGADLRLGSNLARLDFEVPATDARAWRQRLVRLAQAARGRG